MEFFLMQSLGFVIGVFASLAAAYLYAKISASMEKRPTLKIEGVWGEFVPKSTGRNYTDLPPGSSLSLM